MHPFYSLASNIFCFFSFKDEPERATWLETRDEEEQEKFKTLVYLTMNEVSLESYSQ